MAHNRYMMNCDNINNDFDIVADSTTPNIDLFALPVPTPTPPIFYDGYGNNGYSSSSNSPNLFACETTINQGISQEQQSMQCNYYQLNVQTPPAFYQTSQSFTPVPAMQAGHIFVNLVIIDQPVDRCRFRYKAEQGPHGALRAISNSNGSSASKIQKFVPKVKVDNLLGNGYVMVSLWTNEKVPRPHVNELWGSECENGVCKIKLDAEMTASFPNLGVMRQKEKEIGEILCKKYIRNHEASGTAITEDIREKCSEKAQREAATMKDCLHCVRLGFQAFIENPSTGLHIASSMVFSNPIYNSQNPGFSELRIAEIDKSSGLCIGGDTVWMRCATKVKRDQIKIRFCDTVINWESDALFSPNDVYEQILIIFKTPPYHNVNMNHKTTVHIRLYRPTDGEYSPPVEFVYLPIDHGIPNKRAKRGITHESRESTMHAQDQWNFTAGPTWNTGQTYHMIHDQQHYYNDGRHQCKMEQAHDNGQLSSRKRQMTTVCSDCSSGTKIRSLDSGLSTMQSTDTCASNSTIKSPGHILSYEIKSLSLFEERGPRSPVEVQLDALWSFCEHGDMTSLVAANKELIATQDDNGNTVLHIAARNKQGFAMKTMLKVLETDPQCIATVNQQNSKGQTPLHLAVKYGEADCVHYLLKAGADISVLDFQGNSVAHLMADTFNENVYREVLYYPMSQSSTSNSLNVNELNNDGFSALHYAVKKLRLTLVENLLEAKADVNIQERSTGKTALHLAVEVDDLEILQMLLGQDGVEVDKESHDGTTPLQLVVIKKRGYEMARCLLNSGAKADVITSCFKSHVKDDDEDTMDNESNDDPNNYQCEKYSALDFANYDPLLCQVLKNPSIKISQPDQPTTKSAIVLHDQSSSSSSLEGASSDVPSTSSSAKQILPRNTQPDFSDELSSLNFLTRLRLGKILDKQERWVKLAEILLAQTGQAPQVVECIRVCSFCETSGSGSNSSSPSSFLLDQLEQWPEIKISTLIRALNDMEVQEAVELLQH